MAVLLIPVIVITRGPGKWKILKYISPVKRLLTEHLHQCMDVKRNTLCMDMLLLSLLTIPLDTVQQISDPGAGPLLLNCHKRCHRKSCPFFHFSCFHNFPPRMQTPFVCPIMHFDVFYVVSDRYLGYIIQKLFL